jgi:T1SS-143 domain-containing protein
VSTDGAVPPAGATDTFVYTIRDADGDTDTVTLTINLSDVNKVPNADDVTAKVDDDGLSGGNTPGGTGDIDANAGEVGSGTSSEAVWTGTLSGSGGDAPTHFLFNESLEAVHTDTLGTETLEYVVSADGLTLQAFVDGGTRDGTLLFDIVITNASTGAYTLTLHDNVLHAAGGNDETSDTLSIPYQIQDVNNDTDTASINITFNDDAPVQAAATEEAHVDEDELPNGITDSDSELTTASGSISALGSVGADGLGSFTFDSTALGGLPALTSGGATVHYAVVSGTLIAYTGADPSILANQVFTVSLTSGGSYTVTLKAPIDHLPNVPANDDNQDLTIDLSGAVKLTDADGDSIHLDAGSFTVKIEDDVPTAVSPAAITTGLTNGGESSATANLDGGVGGNSIVSDNFGADGGKVIFTAATITALQGQDLEHDGTELTYVISPDGQSLDGFVDANHDGMLNAGDTAVFTIELQPVGSPNSYTVTMHENIDSTTTINFTDTDFDFVGGNDAWFGIVPNDQGPDDTPVDDDSHDLLITPTNETSVNTSGILGGIDTGQSVGSGEGFRIDYVIDLTGEPAGGGADYDDGATNGHTFNAGDTDDHYTTNGAFFTVRQSGGSDILIKAFDDTSNNEIVGDGTQDAITGITITYVNATGTTFTSAELVPTTTEQTVNVGGIDFTYELDDDGESVHIGNVQGATGANVNPHTTIAVFTADGYNSMEVFWEGGETFKFAGFGAVLTDEAPVDFTVPISVTDNDGDVVSSGSLAIHADAPAQQTLSTLSTTSSLTESSFDTSSLVATNDNDSKGHGGHDNNRAFNTGSNSVLMGALAAAGLESASAAASSTDDGQDTNVLDSSATTVASTQSVTSDSDGPTSSSGSESQLLGDTDAKQDSAPEHGPQSHEDNGNDTSVSNETADAQAPADLPQGTEAPAQDGGSTSVTAAAIVMPSAEDLAGTSEGGHAQHNEVVGKVLADALHGGGGEGSNIETLINSLPEQDGSQGNAALDALASHGAAAVPNGDISILAGFSAGHGMHMMEMHQDAAPAHA